MPATRPHGRTRIDPTRQIPARPSTGRIVASPDEWLVALPARMPAYLSVERYEANLARLAANRNTAATPGAVHNGTALLAGLLRCGRCGGRRVNVQYHAWGPAYVCSYQKLWHRRLVPAHLRPGAGSLRHRTGPRRNHAGCSAGVAARRPHLVVQPPRERPNAWSTGSSATPPGGSFCDPGRVRAPAAC
jgi:hypothetical protein